MMREPEFLGEAAPGAEVSEPEWEGAWLEEVQKREALEPEDSLSEVHELPAVRRRLARLFL